MQIIEVTGFGVRSAVITMRRRGTPLTFVLFPMVHVAAPAFYAQVRRRLGECDVIVVEGIRGRSWRVAALTLAYRFMPRRKRSGLQEQRDEDVLPPGVPVVFPDVTADEAIGELRRLPRWQYYGLLLGAPVFGLWFAIRGIRSFTKDLAIDDLPMTLREELLADSDIAHAMLDHRDERVVDALSRLHQERHNEPISVGVVYGAGHIPAIAAALLARHGYRPRTADWFTVQALN